MCEIHRRHSRPTMQEQEDRFRTIAAANEYPLLDTAEPYLLQRSDTAGRVNRGSVASAENEYEDNDPDDQKCQSDGAEYYVSKATHFLAPALDQNHRSAAQHRASAARPASGGSTSLKPTRRHARNHTNRKPTDLCGAPDERISQTRTPGWCGAGSRLLVPQCHDRIHSRGAAG